MAGRGTEAAGGAAAGSPLARREGEACSVRLLSPWGHKTAGHWLLWGVGTKQSLKKRRERPSKQTSCWSAAAPSRRHKSV